MDWSKRIQAVLTLVKGFVIHMACLIHNLTEFSQKPWKLSEEDIFPILYMKNLRAWEIKLSV